MIKFILLLSFYISSSIVLAQNCTSNCTQTISTAVLTDLYINGSDYVCVTSTGSISGNIYIQGGSICNDGNITGNINMTSGLIVNTNTINSSSELIIDNGQMNNQGTITASNLLLNGDGIHVTNSGVINIDMLESTQITYNDQSSFLNNGTIYASTFISDSTTFESSLNFIVTGDFINGPDAFFNNQGFLGVSGDFSNEGDFFSNCTVPVEGDWTNETAGYVHGLNDINWTCSGFSVNGVSTNIGTFEYMHMCDSTNPGSFDSNTGILTDILYCSCSDPCYPIFQNIESIVKGNNISIYPNPSAGTINIESRNSEMIKNIKIYSNIGKLVFSKSVNSIKTQINIEGVSPGLYFIQVDERLEKIILD